MRVDEILTDLDPDKPILAGLNLTWVDPNCGKGDED